MTNFSCPSSVNKFSVAGNGLDLLYCLRLKPGYIEFAMAGNYSTICR